MSPVRIGHLFALLAIVSGALLGDRYIPRLSNHDGYWLVAVKDQLATSDAAPLTPPSARRRVVLIVVDGLRRDRAEGMASARRLAEHGQCRISDQGDYTVSRPVYSLLSTGVEVDRSGSRNNDLTTPLAAESFWEVARRAGLRVRGSSHLSWWRQLFPRGFDQYRHLPDQDANVFASSPEDDARFDVDLYHPDYVDEAGHAYGASSPEYTAAVARADREISGLLDRLDLARDDVILTSDHGHRAEGGHGGAQPELREVLACFGGPDVKRRVGTTAGAPPFDGRLTAAVLSLFARVPFPAHMRAVEDHLDDVWDVVQVDAAFETDRRRAIARFRETSSQQLGAWLGHEPATWTSLYARERRAQTNRLAIAGLLVVALVAFRSRRSPRDLAWLVGTVLAFWIAHRLVLGDLDFTVINRRQGYIPRALFSALLAIGASVGLHRWSRGGSLASRLLLAVLLAVSLNVAHVLVYGWPLGFPLPSAPERYLPFYLAFAQTTLAVAYLVVRARERSLR